MLFNFVIYLPKHNKSRKILLNLDDSKHAFNTMKEHSKNIYLINIIR